MSSKFALTDSYMYQNKLTGVKFENFHDGTTKIENHADRSRKTIRREDIDKVTSFRRNRFLSIARIPGLVRNATGTRICAKNSLKMTEGCVSALTSPIR